MLELNKIYCIDCVDGMKQLEENSIDLVVTSPPYDNLRIYGGYCFNFQKIAQGLFRVISPGGVVVWVIGDATINGSETGSSFEQALYFLKIGFNIHDTMIWKKNSFAFPSKDKYHQTFEYMFVFSKGKPKSFNPLMDRKNKYPKMGGASGRNKDGTRRTTGGGKTQNKWGKRFNVWEYNIGGGHVTKDAIAYQHPAIFPEDLAKDHIVSWSNEGDVVLDPMCGSGTTCKMAKILNRRFIGFEINPDYVAITNKRLEQKILLEVG